VVEEEEGPASQVSGRGGGGACKQAKVNLLGSIGGERHASWPNLPWININQPSWPAKQARHCSVRHTPSLPAATRPLEKTALVSWQDPHSSLFSFFSPTILSIFVCLAKVVL